MEKKIVFVINYFYPDHASTSQLMTDLCLAIQEKFNLTVIAAQLNKYEDTPKTKIFEVDYVQNIKVIRLKLPKLDKRSKLSRLKYIFIYFLLANIALIRERSVDIIYTISTPPVLSGLIGTIGKFLKHSKHIYNIQDFNPEQAEAVHYSKSRFLYNLARKIDNFSCYHSDYIVLVGHDMVETLQRRFINKKLPCYQVINNWTDENDIIPLPKTEKHVSRFLNEHKLDGKFIVMYSGNIGLYYDLENLIKVAKNLIYLKNMVFVFIGDGAVKENIEEYVSKEKIGNVFFYPFQSKNSIKYSLNAADLHLVVNRKGIKGVSVPSKIYGVMAAGKPILGVLESGSEAERLISVSNCGRVVEPGSYAEFQAMIELFYFMDCGSREKMGLNGRNYLEKNLRKNTSINKYENLLSNL